MFKAVPYAKLLAAVPGIEHWKAQARRGNRLIKKVFFFFSEPSARLPGLHGSFPSRRRGAASSGFRKRAWFDQRANARGVLLGLITCSSCARMYSMGMIW